MRRIAALLPLAAVLASPLLVHAQTGPLDVGLSLLDSDEALVLNTEGSVSTYQAIYDVTGAIDLPPTTGGFSRSSRIGLADSSGGRRIDAAVGDFDGDGHSEWISAWETTNRDIRLSFPALDPVTGTAPTQASSLLVVGDLGLAAGMPQLSQVQAPYVDYTLHARELRMTAGDLDADGDDELVLVYRTGQSMHFVVLGLDGEAVDSGERLSRSRRTFRKSNPAATCDFLAGSILPPGAQTFELVTSNFVGDPREEIAVAFVDVVCQSLSPQQPTLAVFMLGGTPGSRGLDEVATQAFGAEQEIFENTFTQPPFNSGAFVPRIAAAPGDFDNNGYDEIILAHVIATFGPGETPTVTVEARHATILPIPDASGAGSATVTIESLGTMLSEDRQDGGAFDVVVGDLDGDAVPEIAYIGLPEVRVYRMDSTPALQLVDAVPYTGSTTDQSHRVGFVSDVDVAESVVFGSELVLVDARGIAPITGPGDLVAYQLVNDVLTERKRAPMDGFGSEKDIAAVLPVNADRDGANLGTPAVLDATDILNPLVYLGAPPVHFDTFARNPEDGSCYTQTGPTTWEINEDCVDLSVCFNPRITDPQSLVECNFYTEYQEEFMNSIEAESEVRSAWSISSSVTGKYQVKTPAVTKKASLKISGGYGENFGKKNGGSISTSITKTKRTYGNGDDWIYALKSDYRVFEYPVEVETGAGVEILGHVVAVEPIGQPIHQWYNATTLNEVDRVQIFPSHEISNLLSYTPLADFDFTAPEPLELLPNFLNRVFFDEVQEQWQISESPSSNSLVLEFDQTDFETTSAASSWYAGAQLDVSAEVGPKVKPFAGATVSLGARVSGRYSSDTLSNSTTTVTEGGRLEVQTGYLDGQVTLFGFGVGEVAYNVVPMFYWSQGGTLIVDWAVDLPQGPASFWSLVYGFEPDWSFVSPWRQDLAKEKRSLNSPALLPFLTRSPDVLVDPIRPVPGDVAMLKARVQNYSLTAAPATVVRFYLGDPSQGGTFLAEVPVDPIPARGEFVAVHEGWIVPPEAIGNRIYAWVDPQDDFTEIHEENNLVWNYVGYAVPEPGFGVALAIGAGLVGMGGRSRRGAKTGSKLR